MARKEPRSTREKKRENMENLLFLILVVVRNFGVWSAASDNAQNKARKLGETRWEKEVVRNSWVAEDRGMYERCEETKKKSEMQTPSKTVRCILLNGSA